MRIMYEEPSSESEVRTQAGFKRPQRTRNMLARLHDCVVTPDDEVNDEGEMIHYAFYADIEPVNVTKTLKDPK